MHHAITDAVLLCAQRGRHRDQQHRRVRHPVRRAPLNERLRSKNQMIACRRIVIARRLAGGTRPQCTNGAFVVSEQHQSFVSVRRWQDAVHPGADGLRRCCAASDDANHELQCRQQLLADGADDRDRRDEHLDGHLHHGRHRAAASQRCGEPSSPTVLMYCRITEPIRCELHGARLIVVRLRVRSGVDSWTQTCTIMQSQCSVNQAASKGEWCALCAAGAVGVRLGHLHGDAGPGHHAGLDVPRRHLPCGAAAAPMLQSPGTDCMSSTMLLLT